MTRHTREELMTSNTSFHDGGCACGHVRYRMKSQPLIVHCCHCSWCQRQNGSAFAVNALIEADQVSLLQGNVVDVTVPSPSSKGQKISRCPNCQVALWSYYLVLSGGIGNADGLHYVESEENIAFSTPACSQCRFVLLRSSGCRPERPGGLRRCDVV